jgi:protein SFI1
MDTAADNRVSVMERKFLERTWNAWRREVDTKSMEKAIFERVCTRLMGEAMNVWKRCL